MKTRLLPLALLPFTASPLLAQTPAPTAAPAPAAGYVAVFQPSAADPLADRQARAAARLSQEMTSGERQLLLNYRALYNELWHNRDGLTPQQVCDALGTRAGSLFVIAGTMANALYQIDPAGLGSMVSVPPGYAVAIHPDGTVTVTTP